MTDRELLELAAKAADLRIEWDGDGYVTAIKFRGHLTNYEAWNPLHDDGDALRLAVKLRIVVDYYERHSSTECACAAWSIAANGGAEHEEIGADPYAAARRAIVRAAAEIGRAMP